MKKLLLIFVVIFVMILTGCSSSTPTAVSTNTLPAPTEAPTSTQPKITDTPTALPATATEKPVETQSNVEEKTTSSPASSEQPDEATLKKYFSELGLGKIAPGGQLPLSLEKNATLFTAEDQIGLYGNILVECTPRHIIYDTQAQKTVLEGGFPYALKGGFAGTGPVDIPAGKYEYKVYVDDTLVAVFPFEVK